jgi:hypothetical protein
MLNNLFALRVSAFVAIGQAQRDVTRAPRLALLDAPAHAAAAAPRTRNVTTTTPSVRLVDLTAER